MTRRFQFNLKAVFGATTKVAIGAAIWRYLPSDIRFQCVGGLATGVGFGIVFVCLVPRRYWYWHWDPIKQSGPPCVTKRTYPLFSKLAPGSEVVYHAARRIEDD
jgi:hypothetical protein